LSEILYPTHDGSKADNIASYAKPVADGLPPKNVFSLNFPMSACLNASSIFIFKKNVSIGSSHKLDKNNSGLPLYPISKLAE